MKLGIAVDVSGVGHHKLAYSLTLLKWFGAKPDAYAVPLDGTKKLLCHIFGCDEVHLKRILHKNRVHNLSDLPVPLAVCGRDILQNQDTLFGGCFEDVPVKKLFSPHHKFPFFFCKKKLLSSRQVRNSSLMMALNQMECEKYIIFCTEKTRGKDRPRCLYWDVEAADEIWQDRSRIIDFLYFNP